jgi:hypothetical protein
MSKKYRSDAMAAIHETMEALHKVGAVSKQTMRRFDDACLTPVQPLSPKQINLNPAVRPPPGPVRHLPPMISNCGAHHLLGDKRLFCNRLQPTVRWPHRWPQLPDLGSNQSSSGTGEREPDSIRELSQYHAQSGEQVGAG